MGFGLILLVRSARKSRVLIFVGELSPWSFSTVFRFQERGQGEKERDSTLPSSEHQKKQATTCIAALKCVFVLGA